ncbi:MAG: hypothetical protein F6J86_08715 [Symploca sp. SIO1B1]|nr:hypothetical protein [Symploca sp. SIO1C2]NER93907.1 hypothetical protein [Symploca sp. SIO1B1]
MVEYLVNRERIALNKAEGRRQKAEGKEEGGNLKGNDSCLPELDITLCWVDEGNPTYKDARSLT